MPVRLATVVLTVCGFFGKVDERIRKQAKNREIFSIHEILVVGSGVLIFYVMWPT